MNNEKKRINQTEAPKPRRVGPDSLVVSADLVIIFMPRGLVLLRSN